MENRSLPRLGDRLIVAIARRPCGGASARGQPVSSIARSHRPCDSGLGRSRFDSRPNSVLGKPDRQSLHQRPGPGGFREFCQPQPFCTLPGRRVRSCFGMGAPRRGEALENRARLGTHASLAGYRPAPLE